MTMCARFLLAIGLASCLASVPPALGQTDAAPSPAAVPVTPIPGPIEDMQPGDYLWAPEIAPKGPVTIIVSLANQRAYAYRNGVPIGVSTVSTGKPGHETPTGVFVILQKHKDHKSNLYDDAPMPFMQRLTWDGIALHAGKIPGYPASHGCIRLPYGFARLLFDITSLGLTVIITPEALLPEVAPVATLPDMQAPTGSTDEGAFRWNPERAPTGPVSIVLSGRDRRIIVLRNGVEIGSSPIRIDGPIAQTEAFTLRAVDADGPHWFRLPLPGQSPAASTEVTPQERARAHLPDAFRQHVSAILEPGATLLVTRESLRSGGTGKRMTVIVADDPE